MKTIYMALLLFAALPFFSFTDDSLPHTHVNYFRFKYDNDFFSQTDRYYTQGIILDFIHPMARRSPLSHCLLRLPHADLSYYGLHLEQDVYTPKSIRYMEGAIYYGERPFTAVFFLSHSCSSINTKNNLLLYSQIDLGFLGPLAKGEEEQKGIHKALDNIEPQGWNNQLSNDVVINYRAKIEKALLHKKHLAISALANVRAGTLFNDFGAGARFQLGWFDNWFNYVSSKKISVYVFGSFQSKFVVYNATLQGGLTNSGNIYQLPASSITRIVTEVSGGIVVAYKRLALEYSRYYISPEFKKGVDHGWGRCSIAVKF